MHLFFSHKTQKNVTFQSGQKPFVMEKLIPFPAKYEMGLWPLMQVCKCFDVTSCIFCLDEKNCSV